ncbi:MAG TPA: extracellular solute-binding protein [Nocardioidaceae bacterium]|nr:extracellular solute-binding protein [Nocardioidaceae bacterium]
MWTKAIVSGRRGRRSIAISGSLLAAWALMGAACGGGDDSDSGSGGDGELLIWSSRDYYVPPDEFKSLEADQPDANINWDVQDGDDILQQLLRMRQAGQTMPDVIQDDTFLMEAYYSAGLLQPVDDCREQWQEENPELYDKVMPLAWEDNEFDGETYGMSITANFDILYYNKPWLEEAGVEPPFETFEEMYDAMVAMKEARPDKIPMTVQALAGEGVTMLKSMLNAVGVPFDGSTPDLTDPAALYVIDFWQRAQADELIPPEAISWGESETRGAFIQQNAGLIFDGITTAGDFNEVDNFDYNQEWMTTPLPKDSGTGFTGNYVTQPRTWAITVDADDPAESCRVLQYLAETDNLIEPLENGSVPMRQTEALDDPRFNEILPFFSEDLKTAYTESESMPASQNTGEVEEILEQLWGEIVQGTDESPEDLANKYQEQLDALD